jgi:hypothetical protein
MVYLVLFCYACTITESYYITSFENVTSLHQFCGYNDMVLQFRGVRVTRSFVICVLFCRSMFVPLYFFFGPWWCLSFNLRILITLLVSSKTLLPVFVSESFSSSQWFINDDLTLLCVWISLTMTLAYFVSKAQHKRVCCRLRKNHKLRTRLHKSKTIYITKLALISSRMSLIPSA